MKKLSKMNLNNYGGLIGQIMPCKDFLKGELNKVMLGLLGIDLNKVCTPKLKGSLDLLQNLACLDWQGGGVYKKNK